MTHTICHASHITHPTFYLQQHRLNPVLYFQPLPVVVLALFGKLLSRVVVQHLPAASVACEV